MSETWKDKMRARLAELDAQILALNAERAEIVPMLGEKKSGKPRGSGRDLARALLSDGKPHRLCDIYKAVGWDRQGATTQIKGTGAVRVGHGLYRMPDGGWPAKAGAK